MNHNIQHTTRTLTYSGITPFALLGIAVAVHATHYDYDLALRAYGTAIVSFLCGIHWAIHLLLADRCHRNLLIDSNVITLISFGSLLLPNHSISFIIQALCLAVLLKLDHELKTQDIIPTWYFQLRRNATIIVIFILITTAYFS